MKIDFDDIRGQATGKWISILHNLGIEVREDGRHGPCPFCGGKDRFRFDDKHGKGTWICNQCGAGDGFALVEKVMAVSIQEAFESVASVLGVAEECAVPREPKMTVEQLRAMFRGGQRISEHDVAGMYLRNRGLEILPENNVWYNRIWESETRQEQRAMLAIFHAATGDVACVHRTYLDEDGNKLDIKSPKKITPTIRPMAGGACRLFDIDGDTMGIAEGIETAIAASQDFKIPFWAATSAPLLERFEPPKQVKHLVIVADNDRNYTGQKAAYSLANRVAVQMHKSAEVHVPQVPGDDWLDLVLRQAGAKWQDMAAGR